MTPTHLDEPWASDDRPTTVDPNDRFYRGTILRINHGRGIGLLRTGNGREVRFERSLLEILDGYRFTDLGEGMLVGFDLGWTSQGLRVTQIKLPQALATASERQGSAEENRSPEDLADDDGK